MREHAQVPVHRRADGQDLREADQRPTEVAKKHGISEQRTYAWRNRFGALEPVDVKRLRRWKPRTRLKKLLAERLSDIEILKEVSRKAC